MFVESLYQIETPPVKKLMKTWEKRYVPHISFAASGSSSGELLPGLAVVASAEMRRETAASLKRGIIAIKCQIASLKAQKFYAYAFGVIDIGEIERLSNYAFLLYLKLAEIYQRPAIALERTLAQMARAQLDAAEGSPGAPTEFSMADWGMPAIDQLALEIKPLLLQLQQQHLQSNDWRTLGFLTTLLNFCNRLILETLSKEEKLLLHPYLKFVEEQVALPWERVCRSAVKHTLDSPKIQVVERYFSQSRDIADKVYQQMMDRFPHHTSCRGTLHHPEVAHSSRRDIEMFQAYFWLAFLEESFTPLDNELVELCSIVYPEINVSWELIDSGIHALCQQLLTSMTPTEADLVQPYCEGFQQAFSQRRSEFLRENPKPSKIPTESLPVVDMLALLTCKSNTAPNCRLL